jgi:Raf kinase inhibitor-like YbhB/YbcL family protein
MQIASPEFEHEGNIPRRFTCQGEDINPTLQLTGVPAKAISLALIVDDPDAPKGTWVHWVVFNISPTLLTIDANSIPGTEGHNDFGRNHWGGPCPPEGTGVHRYYFRLYALDAPLNLSEGATRAQVDKAMAGHILDQAVLMGRYIKESL